MYSECIYLAQKYDVQGLAYKSSISNPLAYHPDLANDYEIYDEEIVFDLPHWEPELAADPILDMCGNFEYSITINGNDNITAYEPAI